MKDLLNTLFIGQQWIHLTSVGSTNEYAALWASKNKPIEGTVISADEQTNGKGQFGRLWHSVPGESMILTVILCPKFLAPPQQFSLSQCISVALYDFVNEIVPTGGSVKWPNDLYLGDKKLGGVLIQNNLRGNRLNQSLVGIGLNINQTDFPDHLPGAISIYQAIERKMDILSLTIRLLSHIERRYMQLRSGESWLIDEEYHKVLYKIGQIASFRTINGEMIKGKILGVEATGNLRLQKGHEESSYSLQEIRMAAEQSY